MKPFKPMAAALVLLAAPLAHGLEVGQCARRDLMLKALAGEGQRVVLSARDFANASPARVHIARDAGAAHGYLLRETGPRGLCVDATLSQMRIGLPVQVASQDRALIERQCASGGDAALCASLRKARKAVARLKVVTVVESSAGSALKALPGMRGIDRHAPAEHWSGAQFGFCRGGGGALVLCVSSYTRAPG